MQQTALDRWLIKEFVYICKVYCNTLPQDVPPGVLLEETSEESGGRYRYCFTVRNDQQMSELTARLEVANITYTSRVSERTGSVSKLFNNPERSFSLQVAWGLFILLIISVSFSSLPVRLWNYLSAEEEDPGKPAKQSAATAPAKP
jgi:hypothetical protein